MQHRQLIKDIYTSSFYQLMVYAENRIYGVCKKSLNALWTSPFSAEIIINPEIQRKYRYCFPTDDEATLLPLLQSRADQIHLTCMSLLSELCDCGNIFFSQNNLQQLRLMFGSDAFFPNYYFYPCELLRVKFGLHGNGRLTPHMKQMLMVGIFIYRVYLCNI
jgi:hypothetical protein